MTRNWKTLREKHSKTQYDINHSKILYNPPPRIIEIKTKINKWNLLKLKSFCTAREIINKADNPQVGRKHLQIM